MVYRKSGRWLEYLPFQRGTVTRVNLMTNRIRKPNQPKPTHWLNHFATKATLISCVCLTAVLIAAIMFRYDGQIQLRFGIDGGELLVQGQSDD